MNPNDEPHFREGMADGHVQWTQLIKEDDGCVRHLPRWNWNEMARRERLTGFQQRPPPNLCQFGLKNYNYCFWYNWTKIIVRLQVMVDADVCECVHFTSESRLFHCTRNYHVNRNMLPGGAPGTDCAMPAPIVYFPKMQFGHLDYWVYITVLFDRCWSWPLKVVFLFCLWYTWIFTSSPLQWSSWFLDFRCGTISTTI